jgi:hypothetical protein
MVAQCKSVLFLQLTPQQQTAVSHNEVNLRQAGLWDYLHTTWDDAIGQDSPLPAVNQFVASSDYCTAYEGMVGQTVLKFTTKDLGDMIKIPEGGISLSEVEPLTAEERNRVFGVGVKKGKEGWNGTKALGVMAGWIPYISQRLFFNMDEKKIDDKYVATAYRAWNGVRINWAEILIVSIWKEISRKKTRNPMLLLSAGYLNVYCKPHIKINLEVVPLCVKEPGEETNSQTRPDGASGPSSKVSTPVTRSKAKMLDIRAEDMEIDPPHSMDGVGSIDPPEDWTIFSRGTKRHREGKEGQMDFTGKGAEDDKREEEERLDHQQGKDELSQ